MDGLCEFYERWVVRIVDIGYPQITQIRAAVGETAQALHWERVRPARN